MWILKHRHDLETFFTHLSFNTYSDAELFLRAQTINYTEYLIVPID